MNDKKLMIIMSGLLIVGMCSGAVIGLWRAPGGESLGPFLKSVIGHASVGGLIGGSGSVIFLVVTIGWRTGRRREGFLLALVLTVGVGVLMYFSFRRVPVECAQIEENELQVLLGSRPISTAAVEHWLHTSTFKEAKILGNFDNTNIIKTAQWYTSKALYVAYFRGDLLTTVHLSWSLGESELEPISDEILSCFGSPDLYQARYDVDLDGSFVDFSLWYLKEGVVVLGKIPYKWQLPVIDGNVRMDGMRIVAPNSAEEMIRNGYPFIGENDEFRAEILETLHPWPGTWAGIVIDTTHPSP